MSEQFEKHEPVLFRQVIANLVTTPDGIYVDATFGRGSHARGILDSLDERGRLIGFDKDIEAVVYARKVLSHDKRFTIFHHSFADLKTCLVPLQAWGHVKGILFDLGVSSPQLENPARGFSFSQSGRLDMRMDNTKGEDALTWLLRIDESQLADVLWKYGEEKYSRRIARAIMAACADKPVTTTDQLAEIIKKARPPRADGKHPATRSFQAIRIAINNELEELEQGLSQALEALECGGRLAVISFHSLEDRIVKQFIHQHEKGGDVPRDLPIKFKQFNPRLRTLGKPVKPDLQEITHNPRARSAILRLAEKLS